MDIRKRLSDLMESKGWTTYALAEQCGLPQSTIANIFSGGNPRIPTLEKICKAFEITLSEFFAEDMNTSSELASQIESLSPKRKELTKAIVKEFQSK